jgi:hypothetical protein
MTMVIILVFASAVAYLIGGATAAAWTVVSGIVLGAWLKFGISRALNQTSSTLPWTSRSSRRLEWIRFSQP